MEIKSRFDGRVIFKSEKTTIKETILEAVKSSIDLSSASLCSADLSFADLRFAKLRVADLRFAKLHAADLSFADLCAADLRFADLGSADLSFANLSFAKITNQQKDEILKTLQIHIIKEQEKCLFDETKNSDTNSK